MLIKRHGGPVLIAVLKPFMALGRFLVQVFGIPIYRFVFWLRRHSSRLIIPAKQKVHFIISNRYAIHFAVVAIVVLTSGINLSGSEVRAETFGQNSLLYELVSSEESNAIEVVSASDIYEPVSISYMNDPVIDVNAHIDFNYLGENYVTTTVGGSSVTSPTIKDNSLSVAARSEVVKYIVEEGDVLSSIAEDYGLALSSLLWANSMTQRSTIRPGQELTVPPVDGVIYKVKKGDTLGKIAKTYDADSDKILAFNALADANDLVVGEELMIPDGEPPRPVVRRTAPVSRIFTPNTSSDNSGVTNKGSASGSGSMNWPTNWRVITQYYGWRHTGVDIDGDYGTRSIASCNGTIIRSGWFSGYGLTLEIQCDGNWSGYVLRYAHHAKNYVSVGEYVTAGQVIAQTGTTGRSTGTHLHFEVIKNGRFQNPLDYIR